MIIDLTEDEKTLVGFALACYLDDLDMAWP